MTCWMSPWAIVHFMLLVHVTNTLECYSCATEDLGKSNFFAGGLASSKPASITDNCCSKADEMSKVPCDNFCFSGVFNYRSPVSLDRSKGFWRDCASRVNISIVDAAPMNNCSENTTNLDNEGRSTQSLCECNTNKCNDKNNVTCILVVKEVNENNNTSTMHSNTTISTVSTSTSSSSHTSSTTESSTTPSTTPDSTTTPSTTTSTQAQTTTSGSSSLILSVMLHIITSLLLHAR